MVGLTDYPDGESNMFKKSFENMTGQGTEKEPYVITNINQLQSMKEDLSAKYTLGCDIDASETENWNDGRGFEPIGDLDDGKVEGPVDESEYSPFTGVLFGNNYTIKNLHINRGDEYNIGLFSAISSDGIVKELNIMDSEITGKFAVGGIVGYNRQGNVTYTSVANVTVKGESHVGGIVGFNNDDSMVMEIEGSKVNVIADGTVGRIVGENFGYVIDINHVDGCSIGTKYVGDICGSNTGEVRIDG